MSRIVLGVGAGIAAYKALSLCSALVQRGDEVDVVLGADAERFVTPLAFAALTHRPVLASLWDAPDGVPHVALARRAEVVALVPVTANLIARLAHGFADDLPTAIALATRAPVVVAPAMNGSMYGHAATVANLATLRARGIRIVEPETGFLAERERDVGRLANETALVGGIDAALRAEVAELAGTRVVVTAGPTREALDPVRFLSNPATGTMGIELAREALRRGASVELVLGPTHVAPPPGVRTRRVTTADEMLAATLDAARDADVAIATAAVADWRPALASASKVKKADGPGALELVRTPDVLAELARLRPRPYLVGFAAETDDHDRHAREKLARKDLDAIAVNDVGRADVGFGTGDGELALIFRDGRREELGRAPKSELAARLWNAILRARAEAR